MESNQKHSKIRRRRRTLRVRNRVRGSITKPRMCIIKSNQNIYVQLIDDENAKTLTSISTLSKDVRSTENNTKNVASAKYLGNLIAESAKKLGIKAAVCDRGGSKYHGVIAAVAQGARENGLEF